MVAFAGWSLPVQFAGTLAEHAQARTAAALFDVSHMGQVSLHGAQAAGALEQLVPGDITGLAQGRQRYTLLTNELGGIIDDLMVAHYPGRLFIVLNASRAEADIAHLRTHGLEPELHADRALLALQGPLAAQVIARLCPPAASLPFLGVLDCTMAGARIWISRSGYTGEDGFEISVPATDAEALATRLLAEPEVAPAGLAARDTLRLEAGLCLYGSDIDMLTSPVEAGLAWTIPKRRRQSLDFLGAVTIRDHLAHGPTRRRVGIRPAGRAPARAGTDIAATDDTQAGTITSGSFSPHARRPHRDGLRAPRPGNRGDPACFAGAGPASAGRGLRAPLRSPPLCQIEGTMAETRYTKDHEWVRLEDDGTLTVGITDHAQEALGDIVFIELPAVDRDVVEGESVATVESTKAANDVYAPLAGRIAEINEIIAEDPGLINRDANGEGWFWRMEPGDDDVFETLMDEEAYETFLESL